MNVALPSIRVLSLFSGVGGLDLGVKAAVPRARTVCYVEREAYAASVLAARIRDAELDDAPIWSDVSTFAGGPWRGAVDLVCGGFPCQDISNAGRREGITGSRSGLWAEYARILGEVRPSYVFVENVAPLVSRGLDRVLGDLAELGFDAEWGVYSAAEAGAPHLRRRIFILAHAGRECLDWLQPVGLRGGRGEADARNDGQAVEHPAGTRREGRAESAGRLWLAAPDFASPFPPGPDDLAAWALLPYDAQPSVCRESDGLESRLDRLRACGNGVVPQQAALAFVELWQRSGGNQ